MNHLNHKFEQSSDSDPNTKRTLRDKCGFASISLEGQGVICQIQGTKGLSANVFNTMFGRVEKRK